MTALSKTFVYFLLMAIGIAINSFVIMKLWNWIVTPLAGFDQLSVSSAFALSVFTGYFKSVHDDRNDDRSAREKLVRALLVTIVKAFWFLILGYIAFRLITK